MPIGINFGVIDWGYFLDCEDTVHTKLKNVSVEKIFVNFCKYYGVEFKCFHFNPNILIL